MSLRQRGIFTPTEVKKTPISQLQLQWANQGYLSISLRFVESLVEVPQDRWWTACLAPLDLNYRFDVSSNRLLDKFQLRIHRWGFDAIKIKNRVQSANLKIVFEKRTFIFKWSALKFISSAITRSLEYWPWLMWATVDFSRFTDSQNMSKLEEIVSVVVYQYQRWGHRSYLDKMCPLEKNRLHRTQEPNRWMCKIGDRKWVSWPNNMFEADSVYVVSVVQLG